jgi:hypothetical protein
MMHASLFPDDSPLASRQLKTDRLFLPRYLKEFIEQPDITVVKDKKRIDTDEVKAAHDILIKWADLERSGKLATMNENQLQGEFLGDVFGRALGYTLFSEGEDQWTLEQHHTIAGQQPDAILGHFKPEQPHEPLAVIELKGPRVHLDRDRSNGRTAIQQCWEYLVNTERDCRWGVVSNMVSFRLYERDSTQRRYEHFSLQSLRKPEEFRQFYCIFHARGLIQKAVGRPPRAIELLKKTGERQKEVSIELYEDYSQHRTRLIDHLHREQGFSVEEAIDIVQRLLDRIIFIAFCEDRKLIPDKMIKQAHDQLPAFYSVTNPRWQNFKNLFKFLDKGNPKLDVPGFNGGLFAESPADDIEIDDDWVHFFNRVGEYDFADEVNLDVLGHLFEKSITELEKLRSGGLFEAEPDRIDAYARMPQSVKRKQMGVYYTPPELTSRIVQYTVDELIEERLADLAQSLDDSLSREEAALNPPDTVEYWSGAIAMMRKLKIVDPACGSGAFLFQAYGALEHRYHEAAAHLEALGSKDAKKHFENIADYILNDNLYGVDLSREAVEITQLALWIRSATPGRTLAVLAGNIVHGNSLVHNPEVHSDGFDWRERFPDVFDRDEAGFDCVIGNPPWERIKLQEREFFSLPAPEIATATNAAKRRKLVAKLESDDPGLYERYQAALEAADALLTYCRKSGAYPLTGKGDINTYAVFAELASQIVAPQGRVGLLTPSGIASDKTTKDFFASVAESERLIRLYDFENRTKQFFPEVDGRFKFCIINYTGGDANNAADYVFFAHHVEELEDRKRHIPLSGDDIKLLNPNTRTCPIFRTRRDAEITKGIYQRVPVLIDASRERTGNPWDITFKTMFHQTNDAEYFHEAADLKKKGFTLKGNCWRKGKKTYLPLYEAKMVQIYDHRAASVIVDKSNWFRQGQPSSSTLVEHQNPEFMAIPRWWVDESDLEAINETDDVFLAFKNVTSPTNRRTMIAAFIPRVAVGNSAPLILVTDEFSASRYACLLANLNSIVLDYVARRKIGNVNLNFFLIEQFPMFTPDTYDKPCPWEPKRKIKLETWISQRVLKLTCTAEDMLPLADACGFTKGSFKKEYGGRLHKWDPQDRANLMAELDAAYFILYGIERDDAEYILSTFKGVHEQNPLLSGSRTTAEHILETYDMLRMRSV